MLSRSRRLSPAASSPQAKACGYTFERPQVVFGSYRCFPPRTVSLLESAYGNCVAHDGGGFGSIIGRNSFQRPWAEALQLLGKIMDIYAGKK
jgi:hypothetical protein